MISRAIVQVKKRVHRWCSARRALRVVPAAEATHREIALTNTTIALDSEQITWLRRLERAAASGDGRLVRGSDDSA